MAAKKPRKRAAARKPKPAPLPPQVVAAVHKWPQVEIFSERALGAARRKVENLYGRAFASKATDRLTQALAAVDQFALEATGKRPRPSILEFAMPEIGEDEVRGRAVALAGGAENVAPPIERLARRHAKRDRFFTQAGAVAAALERRSRPLFPAGAAAAASPTVPSSVTELCWLNGAMRAYVDARHLRDVADEPRLLRLDLPRPLVAEIDGTGPLLIAPQFRSKFAVNGAHIAVAVIDNEIDLTHPALAGRVVQKANYTQERWGTPGARATAIAGIIGSADAGFAGMAPGVTLANPTWTLWHHAEPVRRPATGAAGRGGAHRLLRRRRPRPKPRGRQHLCLEGTRYLRGSFLVSGITPRRNRNRSVQLLRSPRAEGPGIVARTSADATIRSLRKEPFAQGDVAAGWVP